MTGLPAARVTDPTGGKVIKGSKTVFIGSEIEGEADAPSACEPAVGCPVNPSLGVKLLPSETDVALPAPLAFVFSRSYVSSNREIGILGTGWTCSGDGLRIELEQASLEPLAAAQHGFFSYDQTCFDTLAGWYQLRRPVAHTHVFKQGVTDIALTGFLQGFVVVEHGVIAMGSVRLHRCWGQSPGQVG